jgi:haloalkane dehalogenase
LSNGGLPDGTSISPAFNLWRAFSRFSPWFPIGRIVQAGTKRKLSPAETAAYDAPFPTREYKGAARIYPSLVPITHDDVAVPDQLQAWRIFENWTKPFICCFSDGDPITRGADAQFKRRVPGTHKQAHPGLRGGHFIQEDDAAAFAKIVVDACQKQIF